MEELSWDESLVWQGSWAELPRTATVEFEMSIDTKQENTAMH